jgi:alkylation response protein AidB-like acyl-CoA dehydrogenase
MNLLPSTDQTQILEAIRGFLTDEAPVGRLRKHGAIGNPDARLWPELGALGFFGIALADSQGGSGLGSAEETLVFREFGRHLISLSVFGITLGARVAARCGNSAVRDGILAGAIPVGIANPRGVSGSTAAKDFHLFEATAAEWILVLDEAGAALVRRDHFTEIHQVDSTDAALLLERARLDLDAPRHQVDSATHPIQHRGLLLLAAYAVGVGEAARDMAVDYAKVREQFGKPIGSFQAIKHICADMAIRSEAALCQTCFASLTFAEGRRDAPFHVIASKIVATDTALKNAASNIQVHGAFGFSAEADAHHYLKRAHVADLLWGDLKHQREQLVELPTPE